MHKSISLLFDSLSKLMLFQMRASPYRKAESQKVNIYAALRI